MAYTLSERAPSASNLTAKNRVWGFFENSNRTRPANRRQPLETRRKIRLTPTKTASGIPYWPSRDPIEERGGLNLHGFVRNDVVNRIDLLGMQIIDQMIWENQRREEELRRLAIIKKLKEDEILRRKNKSQCCDELTIMIGELDLLLRFVKIRKMMESGGRGKGASPSDIRDGKASELLSCHNINSDLMDGLYGHLNLIRDIKGDYMVPDGDMEKGFPDCWECVLEQRTRIGFSPGWRGGPIGPHFFKQFDHHFVVCKSYDKNGMLFKEISFDLWKKEAPMGGDPNDYLRQIYPTYEGEEQSYPYLGCSK